jgi:hypothetical protein
MQDRFGRGQLKANQTQVLELLDPDPYHIRVEHGEGGVIDFLVECLNKGK